MGRRTDVYALGAILYHALTGRPPFIGEGMADTVQQVLNVEPVSPRVLNPGVPADLETICLKCLEKEPPKRYATAQMLAEELGRYLDRKPVLARPVGRLAKGWRWCRRNPVQASLIAALVTAIVGGFAGVLGQLHRARVAESAAQKHAYVAEMNLARQALEESNLGRARTLLERYWPARQGSRNQKLEIDLRGWEWRWLWQSSQTHERTTLAGASNRVHAVALSPDCRWLVALSARDALRVWDLASRRCVAALPDASYYNDHILLAPDGERLFVGGYETASVRIWKVPSLEPAGELRHGSPVNWIALSLDGRLLAASDSTGVKIWDTIDLRELAAIPSERNLRFGRVALSRDGRRVAFSDYDGRLYVWDWAARRPLAELAGHTRPPIWQAAVQDLAFTPDGTRVLSAGSDRTVRVWELAPGRESGQLPGLREVVTSLAFSPDGAALATTSCDQTVRLWDVATWQHRAILRGHLDEVWDVTFSADGNTLATAGKDQTVKLWEAHPPPERVFSWPVPAGNWVAVVAPEARAIGLTAADGSFRLVDTTTWQEALARSLVIRRSNGGAVAIDPRATCLVVSSEAGPLRTWRLPNGNASAEFLGHTGRVQVVAFSDDGDWLASAGADHTLRLWRTDTRQQMAQFPQEHERVTSLVFSPDANLLGVTFNDDELEIWERASGRRRVRFAPHKNTHEIAFFHRSPRFATGSSDGTVKIWNLRTQRLEALLRGSLRGVNNLAISPDDRRLATGTGEGVIKLWDLELRQEVAVLKGHPEGVTRLAFSRDGRTLLSASTDAVRVWEAPSLAEIEAAEKAKVSVQP